MKCSGKIRPLPNWCITDLNPAFYDIESKTAIEQTARLYYKMQELISEYNSYVKRLNNYIKEFEKGIIQDFNEFKKCVETTINDFEENIESRIDIQDTKVNEAILYMKDNLQQTANTLLLQMLENHELIVSLSYNSTTESLTFVFANNEGGN